MTQAIVEAEISEDTIPAKRIGRRLFMSGLGIGAAGVLFGRAIQDSFENIRKIDPTGVTNVLPTGGRFRIYSASGTYPNILDEEYTLQVDGLTNNSFLFTLDELKNDFEVTHMTKDFQCVTGWRVRDVQWIGVKLQHILDRAAPTSDAQFVTMYSHDGLYTESLTLEQAARDDMLVAYTMSGGSVSRDHGGPVRLVAAPMYGYKSTKWLSRIELTADLQPGYWEVRGYDVDAWVGGSNGRTDVPIA